MREGEDRNHAGGGLGLGLFIAKTLLERSGARITFGNMAGRSGARIEIVWPRAEFSARLHNLADDKAGAVGFMSR